MRFVVCPKIDEKTCCTTDTTVTEIVIFPTLDPKFPDKRLCTSRPRIYDITVKRSAINPMGLVDERS